MIRIIQFGISLLLAIITMLSCSPISKIAKSAKTYRDMYEYYVNDSLRFSYQFAADYRRLTSLETRKTLRKSPFPYSHCIAGFEAEYPDFKQFIFYFKEKPNILCQDTISGESIDSINYLVHKIIPLEANKGYVVLLAQSKKKNFYSLKCEYIDRGFKDVFVGDNYRSHISIRNPFELTADVDKMDTLVNYLLPLSALKEKQHNYDDRYQQSIYIQAMATYSSRISDGIKEGGIESWRAILPIPQISAYGALNDSAFAYLVSRCKNEQVVMFNENHFATNGRLLMQSLLKPLFDAGFRYFALEALWENDSAINQRGFAVKSSGFYTTEPFMANLIREAVKIGYYVISYDDFSDEREKMEAYNLFNKTLAKDSLAKVLVLGGFGHISENPKEKKMAWEFRSMSGVNPLTIEQTHCFGNKTAWLAIVDSFTTKMKKIETDIYIENNLSYNTFANFYTYENFCVQIPKNICKEINKKLKHKEFIISIYRANEWQEDKQAIPVYNSIIQKSLNEKKYFKLPKQIQYYLEIKNVFGTVIFRADLMENCINS